MPTLQIYAQTEVARLTTLEATARSEMNLAQADRAAQQTAVADALKVVSDAELALAKVRAQLGGSEVSANATSGSEALHDALLVQRDARTALLAARVALAGGEDRLVLAQAKLELESEALRDAQTYLDAATTRSQQIATWAAAVASGTTLETLPAAATALLTDAAFVDAQTKVGVTLPAALITRASERLNATFVEEKAAAGQLAALDAVYDGVFVSDGGVSGAGPAAERTLVAAEAALGEYVGQAAQWLSEAQSRLARIMTRRTITTAEADALAGSHSTELAAELAYDQAAVDLSTAKRQLDLRIAELYALDPDAAIDTDTDVTDLRAEITAAEAALVMPGSTAADMKAWQIEVPEFAWDDLLDLLVAKLLLDRLAAIVPADLASAASSAELALAAVLQAELDVDRKLEPIDDTIDRAAATIARMLKLRDDLRRAAVRGLR